MDLLLVAQSVRMLAQSATRGGFCSVSIDCFADTDTRRHTRQCIALSPGEKGFDKAKLLAAADRLAPPDERIGLIYGSGIDTHADLVEGLARGRVLLGNSAETLKRVKTPRTFFRLLAKLGIPYPETRFSPPSRSEDWLVKSGCSEGGKGVGFFAENRPVARDIYYQRYVRGEAMSLLFLADGKAAGIIGFNTQWTTTGKSGQPFLFAGAVNRADLEEAQRSTVGDYASRLAAAVGLIGLNSLDFVVNGKELMVLELNPRPSATMALYDEDFALGLLSEHTAACRGVLPPIMERLNPVRAIRIVYARRPVVVPDGFRWPSWCGDIPGPGALIGPGEPLCTLQILGERRHEVETSAELKEKRILRDLGQ